jgi:hypothetical protein
MHVEPTKADIWKSQLLAEAVWKLTLASSKEQLCVNPTGLRDEHRTDGA